jgi:hypothetical protein
MTQLQPSRCKLAEFQRAEFAITPEEDTPFEALLSPHYWAHVSQSFRPGCKLEIFPPEGHYYAQLLVRDCGRLFAKVAVIHKVDLDTVTVGEHQLDTSAYRASYGGVNAKWCVHRLIDGRKELMKSELGDREEAEAWIRQHVKTVGAPKQTAAPKPAAA